MNVSQRYLGGVQPRGGPCRPVCPGTGTLPEGDRLRRLPDKGGVLARSAALQEQLAEAASLSVPDINHIERGFKRPSLETLVRLTVALHVTADVLLSGIQPEDRSAFLADVQEVLDDCSLQERQVVLEVAWALKRALRETA